MYQEEINKKYQKIHEYRSLLNRTDYKVLRKHDEPEKVVSEEVINARIHAREQINVLEAEIAELELLEQKYLEEKENDI